MRQSPFTYGSPTPRRGRLGIFLVVIIGITVLVSVLGGLLAQNREDDSLVITVATAAPEVEEPAVVVDETAAAEPTLPAFEPTALPSEYEGILDAYTSLGPEEWRAFARGLVQRQVTWQGVLLRVRSDTELWLALNQDARPEIPQAVLHIAGGGSRYSAGELVSFSGTIARVVILEKTVMLHLENVEIF